MTDFYHAASSHQSALMLFYFLSMLLCIGNGFALTYNEKTKPLRFLNGGIFVVLFIPEAFVAQAFRCMRDSLPYSELLPLPMWSLWCIGAVAFVLLVAEPLVLIRVGKSALHRDSVKQAMDTLPGAICYFSPDGSVKLCNLQMHRLFRTLAQSDLQSLGELQAALDFCDERTGVIRLSGELQTYLFPSGKAWRYSENTVTASDGVTYTESIFIDITRLYEDSLMLQVQTKRLELISEELKMLSYNVRSAAKEQEILSAKTTLHDQMGAGVLAVRRILQSGTPDKAPYGLELFRKAVSMIKNDNAFRSGRGELEEFLHDAQTIGVKVIFSGELPQAPDRCHAFILAMRECLTNGVRHAGADEMTISLRETQTALTLQITNNGEVPQNPVTPKGGLKNLQRYITNLKGAMAIQSTPVFMLTVTFAKEEANEKDSDS